MASGDRREGGRDSGAASFEGRDLLIGRQEPAKATGGADTESGTSPRQVTTQEPDPNEDAIHEILTRVRAMEARMDTLEAESKSSREAADALARETTALKQESGDARGVLAEAVELARGRDAEAAAAARVLAEGVAELKEQGEAQDRRLDAIGQQVGTATEALDEMTQAAGKLKSQFGALSESISRELRDRRWRRGLKGVAMAMAAILVFALGVVAQRETLIAKFGDPYHEWNTFVREQYAPLLATCALKALREDTVIRCVEIVEPSLGASAPFYPGRALKVVPTKDEFNPSAHQ